MATLEEFMRTGQLGAVILGASPSDVMTALGDPDDISKKTNPLILKYRCVQLTFWKAPKERTPQLREIVLAFQPFEPPPEFLEITDWNPQEPPSERDFRAFIERVDYPPAHVVEGQSEKAFLFPSGVSALVSEGKLHSIRLQEKENKATPPAPVTDEREATMDQIHGMLIEAEYVVAAGAALGPANRLGGPGGDAPQVGASGWQARQGRRPAPDPPSRAVCLGPPNSRRSPNAGTAPAAADGRGARPGDRRSEYRLGSHAHRLY